VSKTRFDNFRAPIPGVLLAAAALVIVALGALLAMSMKGPSGTRSASAADEGLTISLAVQPFEVGDSVPGTWDSTAFADSLATRLSMVRGIQATTNTNDARFVLRGYVAMKEGRLILATRLGHEGSRDTVWTATFWRSASSGSSVLTDLAAAVAEAVFSESARETLAPKRDKP
jgi:hypothetical protein